MITTPTVSGKPGQAPTGLSCDLYPLIGSHSTWTDPRGPVKGELEPHRVDREHPGRESAQPGVFAAADAVLDGGVGAVPGLQGGQLPDGGVGGERLEPPAVNVGERSAEHPGVVVPGAR